jgi:hypothetical protein
MLKELKLANLIIPIIMLPLCSLMFIPAYPYYIAFVYQCLAVFLLTMSFREFNDIYFSMLLPIRKRDMVRARVLLFCFCELVQIVVAIPVAFLRHALNPEPNLVGIEINPALFGSVLVMYGLFNLIFLSLHYKTAYKLGVPFGVAGGAVLLYIFVAEAPIHAVPVVKETFDVVGDHVGAQSAVAGAGAVVFATLSYLAYRVAAARFEKVDL